MTLCFMAFIFAFLNIVYVLTVWSASVQGLRQFVAKINNNYYYYFYYYKFSLTVKLSISSNKLIRWTGSQKQQRPCNLTNEVENIMSRHAQVWPPKCPFLCRDSGSRHCCMFWAVAFTSDGISIDSRLTVVTNRHSPAVRGITVLLTLTTCAVMLLCVSVFYISWKRCRVITDTAGIVCAVGSIKRSSVRPSVRPSARLSVCPSYWPLQQRAAGLLLWARRARDIDR